MTVKGELDVMGISEEWGSVKNRWDIVILQFLEQGQVRSQSEGEEGDSAAAKYHLIYIGKILVGKENQIVKYLSINGWQELD